MLLDVHLKIGDWAGGNHPHRFNFVFVDFFFGFFFSTFNSFKKLLDAVGCCWMYT